MFYELTVGENTYKLKLSVGNMVLLERKLGRNPLSIFVGLVGNDLPKIEDLLTVIFYAARKEHKDIKMDEIYDIYENYLEEGHTVDELVQVVIEIFRKSGLIKEDTEAKN